MVVSNKSLFVCSWRFLSDLPALRLVLDSRSEDSSPVDQARSSVQSREVGRADDVPLAPGGRAGGHQVLGLEVGLANVGEHRQAVDSLAAVGELSGVPLVNQLGRKGRRKLGVQPRVKNICEC